MEFGKDTKEKLLIDNQHPKAAFQLTDLHLLNKNTKNEDNPDTDEPTAA